MEKNTNQNTPQQKESIPKVIKVDTLERISDKFIDKAADVVSEVFKEKEDTKRLQIQSEERIDDKKLEIHKQEVKLTNRLKIFTLVILISYFFLTTFTEHEADPTFSTLITVIATILFGGKASDSIKSFVSQINKKDNEK